MFTLDELLNIYTRNGLVRECEKRNLSQEGSKKELADRILQYEAEQNDEEQSETPDHEDESADEDNPPSRQPSTPSFTLRDLEDSVEKFGAEESQDVDVWLQDFEEIASTVGWGDLQKFVMCKKVLLGTARKFVFAQSGLTNWRKLKAALSKEFAPKLNAIDIHRRMSSRKKKTEERFLDFVYEMQRLGKMGSLDEPTICEHICDGIVDDIQSKSQLYGAKTIAELKTRIEIYEKLTEKSKSLKTKKDESAKKKDDSPKMSGSIQKRSNCYNCGNSGHRFSECPDKDKGKKCFKCGGFNHIAVECKVKGPKDKKSDAKVNMIHSADECELMVLKIKVGEIEFPAVIDSCSDLTLAREDAFEMVKGRCREYEPSTRKIRGFGGAITQTLGKTTLIIEVDGDNFEMVSHIVPKGVMEASILIGRDFLKTVDFIITPGHVKIRPRDSLEKSGIQEKIAESEDEDLIMQIQVDSHEIDVPEKYREAVENMVSTYSPREPECDVIQTKITLSDKIPIYQRPRRLAPLEKRVVEDQITQWLGEGIIRPSTSDFSSPIVLVKKKDDSYRMCVDYRKLNEKVERDRYPMPIIEDQIDKLSDARVFSTLDLKNSYFHVPVDDESKKYTSFVTHEGQYEFNRTPFGLCVSGSNFCRFINHVLKDLIREGVLLTFVDDLIIPSQDEEEGLVKLKRVFEVAEKNGLIFNFKKCSFLKREVGYLGYKISEGHIQPADVTIEKLIKYPEPKTAKQLQRFYGLASYFRKFVKDFAVISRPLSCMLKKGSTFVFGEDQRKVFVLIKNKLSSSPVLKMFKPEDETEVHTDACKDGIAGIIMQRDKDGLMHPCNFYSRTTNNAERNYHSYELEFLAAVETVTKHRAQLLGTKFKLVTDCSAFKMTMSKKDLHPKIARWALQLSEYDYTIEHRPGERMAHVDAMSRANVMVIECVNKVSSKIRAAQTQDDEIDAIKTALEAGPYRDFVCEGDILYQEQSGKRRLVVPRLMQMEIVNVFHQRGHFGVKKTKQLLDDEYYIPDVEEKIKKCVSACVPCILAEKKQGKREGELMPIPKGEVPFDTLHVDHLGPMPSTRKSYNSLLTVVDAFSKFVWIFTVKTKTCDEALKKLMLIFEVFGYPRRIIADKGSAFTADPFKKFCAENKIELHHVTTGVPRGNGQIERVHRIIIPVLTKLAIDKPGEWFKFVPKVQQYLNSTYQRSIQMTPCELLIGVKMRHPEEARIVEILEQEMREDFDHERCKLRELARRNITEIQEENRRSYNQRSTQARQYLVGDLVAIRKTQLDSGQKLRAKYAGPYEVTETLSRNRYKVKKIQDGDGPDNTTTAADLMKPWAGN